MQRTNANQGIILIDILLALSLSVLFVSIISESSFNSRSLFHRAQDRNAMLDTYEAHASEILGLLPHESRSVNGLLATARWFGNDRIETDVEMTSTTSNQKVLFHQVAPYPFANAFDAAGTTLCSVDYMSTSTKFNIIPILLPIAPSISLTHLEVRNGIAYISADSTKASDSDLFIIDIKDASNSKVLSQINTGPGLVSFTLAGERIFGAAASTAGQLHIIRINSLSSLVLEKKYQLPLPYATATAAIASSIFFNKNKIYLGTEKWDGDEFVVFDVSDSFNPTIIGASRIDSKVNDISVRGNIAYVAASGEQQLLVFDVTDPHHPLQINSFSPSGWSRQEGKSTASFEDGLAFGRTSGGFNITADQELFSWASASVNISPSYVADISGGIYGIVNDRKYIYVISRTTGKELQVFDSTLSTSTARYYSLPVSPRSITCDSRSLYILGKDSPVIYQIKAL